MQQDTQAGGKGGVKMHNEEAEILDRQNQQQINEEPDLQKLIAEALKSFPNLHSTTGLTSHVWLQELSNSREERENYGAKRAKKVNTSHHEEGTMVENVSTR
ncbi:uncharacterized protein LOC112565831 isoform X3 [Pomacea canaliculata]|uniref:uncharacterized protein LOC112565831 isoform X3 n=1 Tax=Pomacea canaliculata TaxID=400727 RepID=UPI000D73F115|nr:uncharacterized protein LOC112565831 isoform X3 [Pomacea canaliculata]